MIHLIKKYLNILFSIDCSNSHPLLFNYFIFTSKKFITNKSYSTFYEVKANDTEEEKTIITNIKAYTHKEIEFSEGVNFISGKNGAGKTTTIRLILDVIGAKRIINYMDLD